MLFADSSIQFLLPFSAGTVCGLLAAVLVGGLALSWLLGPSNPVARQRSLLGLRAVILLLIVLVIFNPVNVQELPGPVQRPEIFYLIDTSASMQMGNPHSRWDQSLGLIAAAGERTSLSAAVVKPFRFGQRLSAIDQPDQVGIGKGAAATSPNTATKAPTAGAPTTPATTPQRRPVAPNDGDTRLQAALKQISSRFGRVPPQGIVVFSDGSVHDETGLEQVAAEFAKLKVPIHVAPIGDTGKGGDVAIAAVVAPPRVRKYTEVEVQVFIRSFGYDGQRGEVRLLDIGEGERSGRKLAAIPVTLQSGFQSVSLSFRTDLSTRKLRVEIPGLTNEVSDKNNRLDTEMAIDRTKIRVLYVEGSSEPVSTVRIGDRSQIRGPFTDLKQALTDDEDIECVVLSVPGGTGNLTRIAEYATEGGRGFPTTVAELSAFDTIVLSDVGAEVFTESQLKWIDEWIRLRGGGLCMVGGEHSFASGGWDQTPLAAMLPVDMLPGGNDWVPGENVHIVPELPASPHPLWNLVSDDKVNRQIVSALPDFVGVNRWAGARPNLATVLATTSVAGAPVAVNEAVPAQGILSTFLSRNAQPAKPAKPAANASGIESLPAMVAGRYGRGRTLAMAFPITSPFADEFVQKWGSGDNRYYAKFCRNLVYWLTENSAIGRRRLVATADKRFYRPGETISVQAATYDESAAPTRNYRVTAMVEPKTVPGAEIDSDSSPLKWPSSLNRESGETDPYIVWGEEFELPRGGQDQPLHAIQLALAEALSSGASSQSLRVELTAYEEQTQVDSTSLEIQILHDPYEQQNPFPNHELLKRVADASGGKVLRTPEELSQVLSNVPLNVGPPIVKRSPMWSNWWLLGLIIGLLTLEWSWRRKLGLA